MVCLLLLAFNKRGSLDQICVLFQGLFSYITSEPVNMSVLKVSSSKAPHSATLMLLIAGIWVFEITVATSCVRSLRSIVKHVMKKTEIASKSINSVRDMSLSWWWPWSLFSSALCCAVVWYNTFTDHMVRHLRCVFINYNWINHLSNTTIWWLDVCCLLHKVSTT